MAFIDTNGQYICLTSSHDIVIYKIGCDKVTSCSIQEHCDNPPCSTQILNGTINATVFSPSGKYFAACTDAKHLSIWNVSCNWLHIGTRLLPRRPTALIFTKCDKYVVIADKAGDVHRFSVAMDTSTVELPSNQDTLLLGHVSMLLDLKLCASDTFLVTCDRDEKIRVSCYPNTFNIQSFCLGHTQFVSKLAYFEDEDLLVSASGDGTVKLWNYQHGVLVHSFDCSVYLPTNAVQQSKSDAAIQDMCVCVKQHLIAVSLESYSLVILLRISFDLSSVKTCLKYESHINFSQRVLDINFVSSYLLVLQSDCISLHSCVGQCDKIRHDLLATIELINGRLTHNSIGDVSNITPVLRKAHIDNMKDYIDKKRQRLEQSKH